MLQGFSKILFLAILVILVGGGFFAWQYFGGPEKEQSYIKIISPNGGEKWAEGNTYKIEWQSAGVEKVGIEAASGGKDKGHIVPNINAATQKYLWEIPAGFISGFGAVESNTMKIRVYDTSDPNLFDENDDYFSVLAEGGESGWQTYQNERFKYEIKYPPELETDHEIFEKYGLAIENLPSISWMFPLGDDPNIAKFIEVDAIDNTEGKSLRSVASYDAGKCKIEEEQDTFLKIDCETEDEIRSLTSAFPRNDWVYLISLVIMGWEDLSGIDFTSEIDTYNLMLSTFKFLEGEIIVPINMSEKDGRVMAHMLGMQTAAQIYHYKNNSYLNLAGDEDMINLQKKIQSETGRWAGFITSNDAYCADIVLPDSKISYCVDAEGRRGENLGCSTTQLKCISY